jgi:hypothetical protein
VTKLPDGKFGPADIGLNDKQLHEARQIRDAEKCDPGVVRRAVDAAIADGKEPTKARVRKAVARIGDNPLSKILGPGGFSIQRRASALERPVEP